MVLNNNVVGKNFGRVFEREKSLTSGIAPRKKGW
jgi:hypothetical protein